jgi:diaminopimelate decarboxylase
VPGDKTVAIRGIDELGPLLIEAAGRFGTPVYVVDLPSVAAAAQEVESAFGAPWVLQYSLKANDLPAITTFLGERGWGGNVVSAGEWEHARHGGLGNGTVSFEGIGKTDAQLEFAVTEAAAGRPLRWLAVESGEEAAQLAELAAVYRLDTGSRPPLDVLLRLNPQVSPETRDEFAVGRRASKFGMSEVEIRSLVHSGVVTGGGLRLRGIHVHVGSDLGDVHAWAQAGLRATQLAAGLSDQVSGVDTVDFGGGFPLPAAGSPPPSQFREALAGLLGAHGLARPARPAIEPGRYLVGAAGWLVSSVLHVRESLNGYRSRAGALAVIDAGMTEFIRPALYGSHHPVHVLPGTRRPAADVCDTALEGAVCESTDSFGVHPLPPLLRGDLLAIENAGAYAASFTSRYNGRPQPAEALIMPDGTLRLSGRPSLTPVQPVLAEAAEAGPTAPFRGSLTAP